jgi:hypothetical protein
MLSIGCHSHGVDPDAATQMWQVQCPAFQGGVDKRGVEGKGPHSTWIMSPSWMTIDVSPGLGKG